MKEFRIEQRFPTNSIYIDRYKSIDLNRINFILVIKAQVEENCFSCLCNVVKLTLRAVI